MRDGTRRADEDPPVIKLKGPFRRYDGSSDGIECDHDGFVLWHGNCTTLAIEAAGASPGDREDFETGTYHTFTIEPTFHFEPADPSVGVSGGAYLDEVELVEVDGVVLENRDDQRAVLEALQPYLDANGDDWALQHLEDINGPPDSGYDSWRERDWG